jgi:DNA polymerase III subunit gamma/tau
MSETRSAAYQALAIKWRPRTFDDLVGQEHVARTLKNALNRNRLHHAYLFCGTRGVGKTSVARILARAINCEKGPTPTPCGVCASCVGIAKGNFPDVLEIDAASNNGVDSIREIRDNVVYAPQAGRFRIYIIDEVHMVTTAGFNALLKTLEEPPPHVKFIFATTEPEKLLPTVLSRVQRFDFRRVGPKALLDRLREIATAEKLTFTDWGLTRIVKAANGSVRDGVSLLDQVAAFADDQGVVADDAVRDALGLAGGDHVERALSAVLAGEADTALTTIAEAYAAGHDMRLLLTEMLGFWRDLVVAKLAPQAVEAGAALELAPELRREWLTKLEASPGGADRDLLIRRLHILMEGLSNADRSDDARLETEMTLLKLIEAQRVMPLVEVLARLEAGGAAIPPVNPPTGGGSAGTGAASAPTGQRPSQFARGLSSGGTPASAPAPSASPPASSLPPRPTTDAVRASPAPKAPPPVAARDDDGPPPWDDTPTPAAKPVTRPAPAVSAAPAAPAPAPVSASRPAGGGATLGNVKPLTTTERVELEELFSGVASLVAEDNKLVASSLFHTRLLSLDDHHALLAAADETTRRRLLAPEAQSTIAKALAEQAGSGPVTFEVEVLSIADREADPDLPRTPDELRQDRLDEAAEAARQQALSHPAVARLIETFSAEVTSFRPVKNG